jgi:hypothetical protein
MQLLLKTGDNPWSWNHSMEHLPLDVFKILVQFVLGPMIVAWFTAELKKRSKPKKRQARK